MATFKVVLQRICYAEVLVEAESSVAAKQMFSDDDTAFEYFTSSGNTWFGPEIKAKVVDKIKEKKVAG
jgi:hypothetical protein